MQAASPIGWGTGVFIGPEGSSAAVKELDDSLDVDEIAQTVARAAKDHAAKMDDPFSPPGAVQSDMYLHVTQGLRRTLSSARGWGLRNVHCMAMASSPSGRMSIACRNGGPGTALVDGAPDIDKVGGAAVQAYGQLSFDEGSDVDGFESDGLWYLLTHVDTVERTVRAELSCPILDGKMVLGWERRIFVCDIPLDAAPIVGKETVATADVEVSRKEA